MFIVNSATTDEIPRSESFHFDPHLFRHKHIQRKVLNSHILPILLVFDVSKEYDISLV